MHKHLHNSVFVKSVLLEIAPSEHQMYDNHMVISLDSREGV